MGVAAYKGRTRVVTMTVYEADNSVAVFGSSPRGPDVFRCKVAKIGHAPVLDISSKSPVTLSHCTAENPSEVTFHAADLANIEPGVYTYEVAIYDASETTLKSAGFGVLAILNTQGGQTGG